VLNSLFSHLFILLHQLRNKEKAIVKSWWRLAHVCGDDILEVGVLAALKGLDKCITHSVDLFRGTSRRRRRIRCGEGIYVESLGSLCVLVHGLGDILGPALISPFSGVWKQGDLPERREEQINESNIRDLIKEQPDIGQELLRLMIIENVHINSLRPAVRKGPRIVLLIDEAADTCHNHGSGEDGLEVSSGHLEDDAHVGRNGSDKTRSTFHASASLIFFRVVCRDFELLTVLAVAPKP
jgi:hypothetical protein